LAALERLVERLAVDELEGDVAVAGELVVTLLDDPDDVRVLDLGEVVGPEGRPVAEASEQALHGALQESEVRGRLSAELRPASALELGLDVSARLELSQQDGVDAREERVGLSFEERPQDE